MPNRKNNTSPLIAAAVSAAEAWLEDNRGCIEEGGTGDIPDLIRRIVLAGRRGRHEVDASHQYEIASIDQSA